MLDVDGLLDLDAIKAAVDVGLDVPRWHMDLLAVWQVGFGLQVCLALRPEKPTQQARPVIAIAPSCHNRDRQTSAM